MAVVTGTGLGAGDRGDEPGAGGHAHGRVVLCRDHFFFGRHPGAGLPSLDPVVVVGDPDVPLRVRRDPGRIGEGELSGALAGAPELGEVFAGLVEDLDAAVVLVDHVDEATGVYRHRVWAFELAVAGPGGAELTKQRPGRADLDHAVAHPVGDPGVAAGAEGDPGGFDAPEAGRVHEPDEVAFFVEFHDPVVVGVGDPDVAVGGDGEAFGSVELAIARAQGSDGLDEFVVSGELLEAVSARVGDQNSPSSAKAIDFGALNFSSPAPYFSSTYLTSPWRFSSWIRLFSTSGGQVMVLDLERVDSVDTVLDFQFQQRGRDMYRMIHQQSVRNRLFKVQERCQPHLGTMIGILH